MIDHSLLMLDLHYGFVQLLVAGVGLAMSAAGILGSRKDAKKQKKTAAQVNQVQNQVATLEQQAADVEFKAAMDISKITEQQEEIRRQVTLNESSRQARQIARETQFARASALSIGENSGALNSSGLQGAFGSIQAQGGEQATTLFENTNFAMENFALNRGIFNVQRGAAEARSNINRNIAPLQTRLRSLGVQSSNTAASNQFNQQLIQTGFQIAGSSGKAEDVFNSLFKRT